MSSIFRSAWVVSGPAPPATQGDVGTIRTLYGRHPVDRKRFSSKVATGKPAVTHWRVVERLPLATAPAPNVSASVSSRSVGIGVQ